MLRKDELSNTSVPVYPYIIYKDDNQQRKIVVIDGKSYYCSTGESSGYSNIWFPFILLRGTQPINYNAFPSYIINMEKSRYIFLGYIVKFEQTKSAEAVEKELFKGVIYNSEELTARLPTKETLIMSVRLSGLHFPLDRLDQVDLTPDEKRLMEQPIQIEEKPIFTTMNPDKINQWLIEQGATIPRAVLQDVNFSLDEEILIKYVQYGMSLLMVAVREGRIDIVQQLISQTTVKEYSINQTCYRGCTLLMFAADRGHVDIVNLLLENGADVKHKLSNGMDAAAIAEANGHMNIVAILKQHEKIAISNPLPNESKETVVIAAAVETEVKIDKTNEDLAQQSECLLTEIKPANKTIPTNPHAFFAMPSLPSFSDICKSIASSCCFKQRPKKENETVAAKQTTAPSTK